MSEKTITIIHETGAEPTRLDRLLTTHIVGYSRSYFQELIDTGLVTINGKVITKSSFVVSPGDSITVTIPVPKQYDLEPYPVKFDVVYINDDFIIINKPAGLCVHPASPTSVEKTLVHGLLHMFTDLREFDDTERPGIVHRLDKDTSGLMVIARTIPSRIMFTRLFKERAIHKTYLAVVQGHPPKEGMITAPIGRNPRNPTMMTHGGISSRESLTYYRTLVYYDNCALVEAKPVTGRTHQIRVHFASIGHGILGDTVYGHRSTYISRQALHAWQLSFSYNNQDFAFQVPVPDDFRSMLKQLNARKIRNA